MTMKLKVPDKAFAFAFSAGMEANIEVLDCHYSFVLDREYARCAARYGTTTFAQEKLCKVAAKKVADRMFQLEPRLGNIGDGETLSFQFKDGRINSANKDTRTLQITSDRGLDFGFNFTRDIGVIFIPQLAACDKKTGGFEVANISADWFGIEDDDTLYRETVTKIIQDTDLYGNKSWANAFPDSNNKFQDVYKPVLDALVNEIERICQEHIDAPSMIVSRFFGDKDYYKVLLSDDGKTVTLQSFNPYKTMSTDVCGNLKFPSRLINAGYKTSGSGRKSETTLTLLFDEGWQLNMRLRSTGDKAKASNIRLDVDFKGSRPYGLYEEVIEIGKR